MLHPTTGVYPLLPFSQALVSFIRPANITTLFWKVDLSMLMRQNGTLNHRFRLRNLLILMHLNQLSCSSVFFFHLWSFKGMSGIWFYSHPHRKTLNNESNFQKPVSVWTKTSWTSYFEKWLPTARLCLITFPHKRQLMVLFMHLFPLRSHHEGNTSFM